MRKLFLFILPFCISIVRYLKVCNKVIMKKVLLVLTLFFAVTFAFAQQEPQFSQNMFNQLSINPGYAGSNDAICATLFFRQQWMGLDGAPTTEVLSVSTPIKGTDFGVGLIIMQDKIGFSDNKSINLAFSYQLDIGIGKLGFGLNAGLFNHYLDGDWIVIPQDGQGEGNAYSDPLIPNAESVMALDLNFGVFLNSDNYYIGLSSTHLNEASLDYNQNASSYLRRHYYLTGGYVIQLPNPNFELTPSVFIKSDGTSSQFEFNAMILYKKLYWGGVSYRFGDAYSAMFGIELPNRIKFGFAYDFTTSEMATFNSGGSVEIMLGYCFNVNFSMRPGEQGTVRF